MKDMAAMSPTASFYDKMPDSHNLVVNTAHPLVKAIVEAKNKQVGGKLKELNAGIEPLKVSVDELHKAQMEKKEEEIPQAQKEELAEREKQLEELKEERRNLLKNFGREYKLVKELTDLAMLANNMLKGEDLSRFVKRSLELIKTE
jgi:molecular chaperone HtpG